LTKLQQIFGKQVIVWGTCHPLHDAHYDRGGWIGEEGRPDLLCKVVAGASKCPPEPDFNSVAFLDEPTIDEVALPENKPSSARRVVVMPSSFNFNTDVGKLAQDGAATRPRNVRGLMIEPDAHVIIPVTAGRYRSFEILFGGRFVRVVDDKEKYELLYEMRVDVT
jgi:hypothetical protein